MCKFLIGALLTLLSLASCTGKKPLVEQSYVDSLINHYSLPPYAKSIEEDGLFWKNRMQEQPENFVAKDKYVHALIARFHLFSHISDLKAADSILVELNKQPPSSTSGIKLTLANVRMLQHQFRPATELIKEVEHSGELAGAVRMMKFDADFELGNYTDAKLALLANDRKSEYAYQFRFAKQQDHEGLTEGAISHMEEAASVSQNPYLKTTALSNAADFSMHSGKIYKAYELYKQCITLNPADFHSMEMLAWLSLVYDNNVQGAVQIFNFLKTKIHSPHILLQLSRAYELTDRSMAIKYALQFVKEVKDPVYHDMYNKYLIELYSGLLNDPSKALSIAKKEIGNRSTPQTYAWLAQALYSNGQPDLAYNIFKEKVAGHSLEGMESFSIAKLLISTGKEKEAREYLKAAKNNYYELTPSMARDLYRLQENDK